MKVKSVGLQTILIIFCLCFSSTILAADSHSFWRKFSDGIHHWVAKADERIEIWKLDRQTSQELRESKREQKKQRRDERRRQIKTHGTVGYIGHLFREKLSHIKTPFRVDIQCLSNCRYYPIGHRIVAKIRESDKIVIELTTKNTPIGGITHALKYYPETLQLEKTVDVSKNSMRLVLTPNIDKARRRTIQKDYKISDTLILGRVRSDEKRDLVQRKQVRLRFEVERTNRPPVIDAPSEIVLKGAQSRGQFKIHVSDPDRDAVRFECKGRQLDEETFEISEDAECLAYDGIRGKETTFETKHVVKVTRQNHAPLIKMEERILVHNEAPYLDVDLDDTDGDRVALSCRYNGMEICFHNRLNLIGLPKGQQNIVQLSASDGMASSQKQITVELVATKTSTLLLELISDIALIGSLNISLSSENQIVENNIPGFHKEGGEWQYSLRSNDAGQYRLVYKTAELEQQVVILDVRRRSRESLPSQSEVLGKNQGDVADHFIIALPNNMGCENAKLDCILYLDHDNHFSSIKSHPLLAQIKIENGKMIVNIDWKKINVQKKEEIVFMLLGNGGNTTLRRLNIELLPEGFRRDLLSFSLKEGELKKIQFPLEIKNARYKKIHFLGQNPPLVFLDEAYSINEKNLLISDDGFFVLGKDTPGIHNLPVRVVDASGNEVEKNIKVEIIDSGKKKLHISLYNTVDYSQARAFSMEKTRVYVEQAIEQYKDFLTIIVDRYQDIKFLSHVVDYNGTPDYVGGTTSSHEETLKQLAKGHLNSIVVLMFKTVRCDDGTRAGGFAPLPAFRTQNHYVVLSSESGDATLSHELGHDLGLQHTFYAANNPHVVLCRLITATNGQQYCKSEGVGGTLLAGDGEREPLSDHKLPGDSITDTPIDAYDSNFFSGLCYAQHFEYENGFTKSYYCPKDGTHLGKNLTREDGLIMRPASAQGCSLQYSAERRIVICKGDLLNEDEGDSVARNVMSYWPDVAHMYFTEGQRDKMDSIINSSFYKIQDYVTQ